MELTLEGLADVVIWGAGREIWVHNRFLAGCVGGGGSSSAADPSVRLKLSVA